MTAQTLKEGRRITLNEVSEETGICRPTLTRISNVPGYNTNTDTISALSDYFEIEPGELLKKVWTLGANWAQLNFRESPLAIFTFGENAVGLDFLRFAKKASW